MKPCLFCESRGPYSTVEHIIPESLGNDDLLLRQEVCDSCQAYFGKEIERFALSKTPIGFWRTFRGIKTKKGKIPSVDLTQPKRQKGVLPATHPDHDDVGYAFHDDGSVSVDIADPEMVKSILDGSRNQFRFVFTPKVLHMLGRFLCKIGVELLCLNDHRQARSDGLSAARRYARYGDFEGLWPIFHFSEGTPNNFRRLKTDGVDVVEEIDCYSYSMLDFQGRYLLQFSVGTDNWVICLNDPYPHPVIRKAFPDRELNLIWYPNEE